MYSIKQYDIKFFYYYSLDNQLSKLFYNSFIPDNFFSYDWHNFDLSDSKIEDITCFTFINNPSFINYLSLIRNFGITHIFTNVYNENYSQLQNNHKIYIIYVPHSSDFDIYNFIIDYYQQINIITSFYISQSNNTFVNQRNYEIKKCLLNNLKSPLVKKIHLFVDNTFSFNELNLLIEQNIFKSKINIISSNFGQPKYSDLFTFCKNNLDCSQICMIINSDIYIHHFNISLIYNLNSNLIYSLTRFEYDMSYPLIFSYFGSHDTFIFKNNINFDFIQYLDYYQNVWGSELTTMFHINKNNIKILNPAYQLQTIHFHKSELRNNDRLTLDEKYYFFSEPILINNNYDNIKLINVVLHLIIKNFNNYKLTDHFDYLLLFNHILPKTKKCHFYISNSNQSTDICFHNFNTAKFTSKTINSKFNIIVSNSNNQDFINYSKKFKNLLNPNIHTVFINNIQNLKIQPDNSIFIPLNYIYINNFHKYFNNIHLSNIKSDFCLCLDSDLSNNNFKNLLNSINSYKNITFINNKSFDIYYSNSYIHYFNSFKFIIFFDTNNLIKYSSLSLLSHSIPICLNNSSLSSFFNPNSFLFIPSDLSTNNINLFVNNIKDIDNNNSLYNSFLNHIHPNNLSDLSELSNYKKLITNSFYSKFN
jgi:hypothetical protein